MALTAFEIESIASKQIARAFGDARDYPVAFSHFLPRERFSDIRKAACHALVLKSTLGGFANFRLSNTVNNAFSYRTRDARQAGVHNAIESVLARSYPWDGSYRWPELDTEERGAALLAWHLGVTLEPELQTVTCCDDDRYVSLVDDCCRWFANETRLPQALTAVDAKDTLESLRILLQLARPTRLEPAQTRDYLDAAAVLGTGIVLPYLRDWEMELQLDAETGFTAKIGDEPEMRI